MAQDRARPRPAHHTWCRVAGAAAEALRGTPIKSKRAVFDLVAAAQVIAYFDTSAVVPLLVVEAGSDRAAARLWDGSDRVMSGRLVYPEGRAARAGAPRRKTERSPASGHGDRVRLEIRRARSRRGRRWARSALTVLGAGIWLAVQPLIPLGHIALRLYASHMPEGDQKVFADPEMEAMFLDDIANARHRRFGAVVHDVALFGRPWGFDLSDIHVPVFWWHGDADNIVPLEHAEHSVALLRACEFAVRPTESHLGGFAAADVVLETLANAWNVPPTA